VTDAYDVVVVGAGTSGGVVASRLSEEPGRRVLLVEAGPDFPHEADEPPAFLTGGTLVGEGLAGAGPPVPDLDWGYRSEPLESGRRVSLTRGRMVGGSSMANGCVFVRGRPDDYDAWETLGARGWGWDAIRPDFELVEREVPSRVYPTDSLGPLQQRFLAGWQEVGYRWTPDLNAPDAWDGVVGHWPQNRRNEIRLGSLVTYVRRARTRPNFEIRDRTVVDRVVLDGSAVRGVRGIGPDGQPFEVEAITVVLSAGAYGTPPILWRSGIGPAGELRRLGIDVRSDLPVGRGLMEHPQCLFRIRMDPVIARLMVPWYAVAARGPNFWSFPLATDEEQGAGVIAIGSTVEDRSGCVSLSSADPSAAPVIFHPYDRAIDRGDFREGWQALTRLLASAPLREGGIRLDEGGRSLETILRERLATAYHPAGGASIGSVVDERLAVFGYDCLFVADASVFPGHVTNNPNLTCFVVGERAARFVACGGR
jgi:choline dehydrogenase